MIEHGDMHSVSEALKQLAAQDAAVHDPLRFAYLRGLYTRLACLPRVPPRLWEKMDAGLAQCQQSTARRRTADTTPRAEKASLLAPLLAQLSTPDMPQAGDTSLADLLHQQARYFLPDAAPSPAPLSSERRNLSPRLTPLLAPLREARAHQQRRQRLDDMIQQAPHDAGPLNSHRIVARALATLQQDAPAYLDHLINYLDTLIALEQTR